MTTENLCLKGRVFITFDIHTVTGLHIGGSDTGIEIGGVDKTIIRDRMTNRPYIPGSSLRGKMRSLLEKYRGLEQNQTIGQGKIHSCADQKKYEGCDLCQVFGVPGERKFTIASPTRLIVRDVHMTAEEAKRIEDTHRTDLPYTEIKTEVSIDRVTSAANPRSIERVPAETVFGKAEFVYSIYDGKGCSAAKDIEQLSLILEGLTLLEDDYLGGAGSRGSGKVRIDSIEIAIRNHSGATSERMSITSPLNLSDLRKSWQEVQTQLRQGFVVG